MHQNPYAVYKCKATNKPGSKTFWQVKVKKIKFYMNHTVIVGAKSHFYIECHDKNDEDYLHKTKKFVPTTSYHDIVLAEVAWFPSDDDCGVPNLVRKAIKVLVLKMK